MSASNRPRASAPATPAARPTSAGARPCQRVPSPSVPPSSAPFFTPSRRGRAAASRAALAPRTRRIPAARALQRTGEDIRGGSRMSRTSPGVLSLSTLLLAGALGPAAAEAVHGLREADSEDPEQIRDGPAALRPARPGRALLRHAAPAEGPQRQPGKALRQGPGAHGTVAGLLARPRRRA